MTDAEAPAEVPDTQELARNAMASQGLTRITVNLTPRAVVAMADAGKRTGDSRTDTVNRALQAWALILRMMAEDGDSLRIVRRDGTIESFVLV